jgi:RNA 2',3'-cyclic 3'-phosphodiesterase
VFTDERASRMPEQFSLPELEPGTPARDSLFFAIYPDSNAAEQIARLADRQRAAYRLKGKRFATQRFHVTLHHLGSYVGLPREIVASASAAASMVTMPCFDVTFDRATSFRGKSHNRPFVLAGENGVVALKRFQHARGVALQEHGLLVGRRPLYTPHVTLQYGDAMVDEHPVDAVSWTVRDFVLVRSLLGRGQHIALARWSLLP